MLYIPRRLKSNIGGPTTFIWNLEKYLNFVKYPFRSKKLLYSSIFFPIKYNIDYLKKIKKYNIKIIQRLDGIYYISKHGLQSHVKNKNIKYIYKNLSDYIIFQSEYSKKQVFELFGEIENDKYSIIFNGADDKIFYPSQKNELNSKIIFITTGNFRNPDMLIPIINALDNYFKSNKDFELKIIGPVSFSGSDEILRRTYVTNFSLNDQNQIAEELRTSDIFLYSHLNPPCPNSIIEAISCALPVVGFDSGSMKELLDFNKDLLAYVSDDTFQKIENFDSNKLLEKIELCIDGFTSYKKRAIQNTERYTLEKMGEKYQKVFSEQDRESETKKTALIFFNIYYYISRNFLSMYKGFINKVYRVFDVKRIIRFLINKYSANLSAKEEITYLLELDNFLYKKQGKASIRYGNGLHTKHRHMSYHDFFTENINNDEKVLDIGCGNGALAFSIASSTECKHVEAIDMVEKKILAAREQYDHPKIDYIVGDALRDLSTERFDVVVLSNVLEHIDERVNFLKDIKVKIAPDRFLIRVPVFDRDWRVPLKKELGIDWKLDKTHETEYTFEEFEKEIDSAGLRISSYKINWGEIWAVVK